MFGDTEHGTDFAKLAKEARERQGEALDYNALLIWKLASILGSSDGSNRRKHELQDLEHMLHPLWDADYKEWRKKFLNTSHLYYNDEGPVGKRWLEVYQGMWLEALVDLMKRVGLLPMTMI